MDIVILAGGLCDPETAEATGCRFRAELPYKGRTMLETVISAVSPLGSAIVVGEAREGPYRQVVPGASFIESLQNGLDAVSTGSFLLVTADLPCLTTAALEDFVRRADVKAAFNYPVIPVRLCDEAFPGMKRTTLRLKDGEFTGGNIALMSTDLMQRALPVLQRAYAARKSPGRLAAIVGFGTLARVLLAKVFPKTLSLAALERIIGRFLGVPVRAIETPFAEIGADIDNLSQYNSLIALKKGESVAVN